MDNIQNMLDNSKLDITPESIELRHKILDLVKEYTKLTHNQYRFIPGKSIVPVSGKVFDNKELQMLVASSLDFWLTTGRYNIEFEKQLSEFLNINYTITTNSGSSANLLAITSLTSRELGERALNSGDEVLTVAAGFPTTVNPILQNNLVPVFVDVELSTYAVNTNLIEDAITDKTKAIVLAHTLGNPFSIDKIISLAKKHNLWIVEDCCDALGTTYNGKFVGTFGDIATLSFYPAHHITMGEGGAVLTNKNQLKRIIESFRDWGRDCFCAPGKNNTCGKRFEWKYGDLPYGYDHKYTYSNLGYNLKITDMQAAIGLAQLQRLPQFIELRKKNFAFLKKHLSNLKKLLILPEPTQNSEPAWFGFPITVKNDAPFTREDLILYLSKKLIDTRPLFAGNITKQPYFKNQRYRISGNLTNTDIIMKNSFWIGVYPGLTNQMLSYVVEQIQKFTEPFQ